MFPTQSSAHTPLPFMCKSQTKHAAAACLVLGYARVGNRGGDQLSHLQARHLAAKELIARPHAHVVGVLPVVARTLHAAWAHNHVRQPAVLQGHLRAPLLDQHAAKYVQYACAPQF